MSDSAPASNEEEIAGRIANQVFRAVKSDTPLFLIVYYEHEEDKLRLLDALKRSLGRRELSTKPFAPGNQVGHGAGKLYPFLSSTAKAGDFALVADLGRTPDNTRLDPDLLAYLNLHRDRVASDQLRFVIFLHNADAEQFITAAGDLWDFRHQTFRLERKARPEEHHRWQHLEKMESKRQLNPPELTDIRTHVKRVRPLIAETAEPKEKAALLLDLARWLRRRNAAQLSAEVGIEGIAHIAAEKSKLHASLEHAVGYALDLSSSYHDALRHYELSLAISREIGDRAGEGATLNNISQIYDAWGQYDEALEALEESLDISREIGDRAGEGTTLNNISQIYHAWGRYDEALKALEESLAIRREIGDRTGEGTTLNNISQIYYAWGRYDEALKVLEESLDISREIGDRAGEAITCWNLAIEWKRRGEIRKAMDYARITVDIEKETSNPDYENSKAFLRNLEKRLIDKGNPEEP